MNLFDLAKRAFSPDASKAQITQPVYDDAGGRIGGRNGVKMWTFVEPRRGSKMLRRFADNNEFVRTAINRRKRQIGTADLRIVRRDDPNAKPDENVIARFSELIDVPNPLGESWRSLLDKVVEDILVLDAGCIEKEKTLGGQIKYLHGVNGATIAPDPVWDGSDPRATRYRQYDAGRCVAELRNDQLVYVMMNPSTHRVVGWSPLETLFRVVRAELYGEDYDYEQMRKMAPNVALYLGAGITNAQRDAFATYWNDEIAGTENIAFLNNADPEAKGAPQTLKLREDTFETRLIYKKWLATKIAAVFEMDLTVFNLTAEIQKSLGNTLTARTDEGANGLASGVADFLTREVLWEIDPSRRHKVEFDDLNQRDELAQTKIDDINIRNGSSLINEVRADRGKPPVEYGDEPPALGPAPKDPAGDGNTPNDSSDAPDASGEREGGKSAVPFVGARPTRTAAQSSLAGSSASARVKPSA